MSNIAKIKEGEFSNLSISIDEDEHDNPIAVLLFIPWTQKHDHFHIELGLNEVKRLHDWLTDYLQHT